MQEKIALSPFRSPINLPSVAGHSCVSRNIDAPGQLLSLWVIDTAQTIALPRTFDTHAKEHYSGTIATTTASSTEVRHLPSLTATYPIIQGISDKSILIAGSRCRRFDDGVIEQNATIYNEDGSTAGTFTLGDGIEHIQIDSSGQIWVGYFDEGVFGNLGWGSHPIGVTGLECFGINGQGLWSFAPPAGFDTVADLYTLNVAGNQIWTCYYTEFPIVHIDAERRVRAWRTELQGIRALAVAKEYVLTYGGYNEHRDDCQLLRLKDDDAEIIAHVRLLTPDDLDLRTSKVIGRGNMLHIISDDKWYTFEAPHRL